MDLFFDSTFWVEWGMLSAVLGIGLWVSLVDISTRRVPNKWTYSLLSIGLLGQGFMLVTEVTTPTRLAGVFGISLIIAMVLMVIRFWGPGDGKLFWATALALPPSLCPTFQAGPRCPIVGLRVFSLEPQRCLGLFLRHWQKLVAEVVLEFHSLGIVLMIAAELNAQYTLMAV